MDRVVLAEKLESLRRCVQRVESRRAESVEGLVADIDRQDIVSLNLTRAVQLCVDMAMHVIADSEEPPPQSMGEAFTSLVRLGVINEALAAALRSAVGFRNIAVHAYQGIDWSVVHRISHDGLASFREFARVMAQWVDP